MIRITWNNLTPPGYTQRDIIDFLLIPAIFENPELGKYIQHSVFYKRKRKGSDEEISFPAELKGNKSSRSRLFSYREDSGRIAERMMELLLCKTENEKNPYTMSTYPIRHEFKKQWKTILSPVDHLSEDQKGQFKKDKKGYYYTKYNRRLLTEEEVKNYKEYISLFFKENKKEDFAEHEEILKRYLDITRKSISSRGIERKFDSCSIVFKYDKQDVHLDHLLNSITASDYSKSPYKDEKDNPPISNGDNLFFERLSTMSVIACVWYIWEKAKNSPAYASQVMYLAEMLFPEEEIKKLVPKKSRTISSDNNTNENKSIAESSDIKNAEHGLEQIEAYLSSGEYKKAGILCEKIFRTYKQASDLIKGKTLAYLVKCCENGYPKPPIFSSIDAIKKEALNYGCIYIAPKRNEIKANPARFSDPSEGIYTINCQNAIYDRITETSPSNWALTVSSEPESTLVPDTNQRIILIDDNFEANMQDAINILDKIKKSISANKTSISSWKNLELYIRCNENDIAPLLDTALSYFTEDGSVNSSDALSLIKIYLIDEAKRSADYLFAKYPHFYPLTFERSTNSKNKTIHLVIVSDNPDQRYSKWLIKEGFWTLPRYNREIHTKITLISPHASEICYSIASECPGLADFSTNDGKTIDQLDDDHKINIPDIPFTEISYKSTSFSDRSIWEEIKKVCSSDDYLYFVIDSFSDLEGIKLGTRIRELVIRKTVYSGRIHSYSKKDYIIAVHCINPDYAGLSQDLIVPKEKEYSNQWFNDYNLLTFGSLDELYSWKQLNGGVLEELSQCFHLQYSGSGYSKKECKQHLASYFRRLYNRDSSFSAAVSLPYRLFEAGVTPDPWFIQNPDSWWSREIRKELAKKYNEKLFPKALGGRPDEKLRERLAKYEHMRWCCYQLTRGWLPVKAENVVQYISAGVKRHVLQIAKLHPCICSWKELEYLHIVLCNAATRRISYEEDIYSLTEKEILPLLDKKFKKYYTPKEDYDLFQKIDYKNIEETAHILNIHWQLDKVNDNDELTK